MERLQKIISKAGLASRREAEKMIVEGRVSVNGKVVTELGTKIDIKKDKVFVDNKKIAIENMVYLILHKPKGIVTTLKDEKGRMTVIDLIKDVPERVYPVGRLDYNTEGLLILTNDGELTNKLIHPSFKIYKTYIAKVKGIPAEEKLDILRVGVRLEDGITAPAKVNIIEIDKSTDSAKIEIVIHEGKNRQVRRMFEAIDCPVRSLKRIKFASLNLDGLARGKYRYLSENEIEALQRMK